MDGASAGMAGLGARHCDKGMRAADWPICAGQVKGSSKPPAADRQLSLISSHWPRLLGFELLLKVRM
jgi:hypothetical protein